MIKKICKTKALNKYVKRRHAIPCQWCEKVPDVQTCGRCREINKFKMVEILLEMDKVCLLHSQINRKGRPKKEWNSIELKQILEAYRQTPSIRKVARQVGKSKSYIATAISYAKENKLY